MTGRVEVVGVSVGFLLGALLTAMTGENVFVMVEIVMFIFVKECFRHDRYLAKVIVSRTNNALRVSCRKCSYYERETGLYSYVCVTDRMRVDIYSLLCDWLRQVKSIGVVEFCSGDPVFVLY